MVLKKETEVLVVGAGPVGMFAALELAERGIAVELVDESWRTAARSYALALHPRSLQLLDAMGLLEELLQHGHRVDSVAFYEGGERRAEVALADVLDTLPFLLVLPQDRLERALSRRLTEKGVEVHWNRRLAGFEQRLDRGDRRVVAQLEVLAEEDVGYGVSGFVAEERVRVACDFLIGADGHRSSVRRLLGLDFGKIGTAGDQVYAVFEQQARPPSPTEVRVVLGDATADVLWPLAPDRLRWSFELTDPRGLVSNRAKGRLAVHLGGDVFPYLDHHDLARLIAERAPWSGAEAEGELNWSVAVRFERRLVPRFGDGRVWLAGDAAHLTGPVGVQSMNVGLREAHELAWRIAEVVQSKEQDGLMVEYDSERMAEWRRLFSIGSPVEITASAPGWVARRADRLITCLPVSGEELSAMGRKIGLAF